MWVLNILAHTSPCAAGQWYLWVLNATVCLRSMVYFFHIIMTQTLAVLINI